MSPCPAVRAVCGPDGLSTWQYVEEEAIDLCCRPEFIEIDEVRSAAISLPARRLAITPPPPSPPPSPPPLRHRRPTAPPPLAGLRTRRHQVSAPVASARRANIGQPRLRTGSNHPHLSTAPAGHRAGRVAVASRRAADTRFGRENANLGVAWSSRSAVGRRLAILHLLPPELAALTRTRATTAAQGARAAGGRHGVRDARSRRAPRPRRAREVTGKWIVKRSATSGRRRGAAG